MHIMKKLFLMMLALTMTLAVGAQRTTDVLNRGLVAMKNGSNAFFITSGVIPIPWSVIVITASPSYIAALSTTFSPCGEAFTAFSMML